LDFTYGEEEERFRSRLRVWLEGNLPRDSKSSGYELPTREETARFLKSWERKLYDAGYSGISWPKEYGGRGLPPTFEVVFFEELARARAPRDIGYFGKSLVGPTILAHGSEEHKKRYLPKILTGEEIWCQGFSEPTAGSDLGSLSTSAKLSEGGEEFRVTGQKIWTSAAQYADLCLLLARTDPNAPKHKGISYLIVDMKEEGIKMSPIVQLTGEAGFNQIFFENVRVPKENLLGKENEGWMEAMTTLSHERGVTTYARVQQLFASDLQEMIELCKALRKGNSAASNDSMTRQNLAKFYAENSILKLLNFKQLTKLQRNHFLGAESSVSKLFWSEMHQRFGEFAMNLLGERSVAISGEDAIAEGRWQEVFLFSRAETIYAGTSEIQRNIIAEQVLSMPRIKGGSVS
jgi:alkylation response protein AidB-like acyl-CoA dehydrogenase